MEKLDKYYLTDSILNTSDPDEERPYDVDFADEHAEYQKRQQRKEDLSQNMSSEL